MLQTLCSFELGSASDKVEVKVSFFSEFQFYSRLFSVANTDWIPIKTIDTQKFIFFEKHYFTSYLHRSNFSVEFCRVNIIIDI